MGMDGKRLFDDRVAQVEKMHYKDKSPLTWVKLTRNYLISRVREASGLLQWAADQGKVQSTEEMIANLRTETWPGGWMSDLDPVSFSEQLRGFMNLQISPEPDGPAKLGRKRFDNVKVLNGLEAWRRLVTPLESKTLSTRLALRQIVQNPTRAKTIEDIEDALEEWDSNVTRYILADGPEMPESEKVGVALRVMPLSLHHSIIRDLRKSPDYETLKDSLSEEVNFMREHRKGPSLEKGTSGSRRERRSRRR